jgi:hypothetical protein
MTGGDLMEVERSEKESPNKKAALNRRLMGLSIVARQASATYITT